MKIVAGWWMVSRAELTKMLDRWEEQRERNPALSVDEFVASFYQNAPASLIAVFRRQVARLQSVDDRIGRVGAIDTTSSSRSDANTDRPRTGFPAFAAGVEPIPGYILVERLGAGGFGEVWKATSPGGFSVALKFVAARGRAADVELRALKRIKAVRHPHLLSIFGTWKLDGLLVIASELADGTLLDRFYEARKQGHPGLPRKELLEYFSEAAKGIDFLNRPKSQGDTAFNTETLSLRTFSSREAALRLGTLASPAAWSTALPATRAVTRWPMRPLSFWKAKLRIVRISILWR